MGEQIQMNGLTKMGVEVPSGINGHFNLNRVGKTEAFDALQLLDVVIHFFVLPRQLERSDIPDDEWLC